MTKRERLFALVEERIGLQQRLDEINTEIDDLFDEGGTTRPGRRPSARKEATTTPPRRGESNASGGAALPPVATNGHRVRQPSEQAQEAEAMARDGLDAATIATRLGFKGRPGLVKVRNYLYRARQAGRLPKAEASR